MWFDRVFYDSIVKSLRKLQKSTFLKNFLNVPIKTKTRLSSKEAKTLNENTINTELKWTLRLPKSFKHNIQVKG